MSEDEPFRLNKYMPRTSFEGILSYLSYIDKSMLNIMMVSSSYVKWRTHVTLTWLNNLIHHRLI